MTDKILCPWCGAEMEILVTYEKDRNDYYAYSMCRKCDSFGPTVRTEESAEYAVEAARAAALRRYMPEDKKGLYGKYIITRADGTPVNDRCFVLKPDKDPAAAKALQAYAAATDDEQLRDDLYAWVGKPMLKPLTLEEAIDARAVWIELQTNEPENDLTASLFGWQNKGRWVVFIEQPGEDDDDGGKIVGYNPFDYGRTWRCWLRKPTKEEMEAAKWER